MIAITKNRRKRMREWVERNSDSIMMYLGFILFDVGLVLAILGAVLSATTMLHVGIVVAGIMLIIAMSVAASEGGFGLGIAMILLFPLYAVVMPIMMLAGDIQESCNRQKTPKIAKESY